MKSKSHAWSDIFLKLTILITLLGSIGCFYPKAERAPGELVSDVAYEIVVFAGTYLYSITAGNQTRIKHTCCFT